MNAYDPAKCAERLGKLTASKAAVIMGKLDTSGLATYVKALAWERVYGARDEEYRSDAMQRGNDLEPSALDWYEFETAATLTRTPGFMRHPTIPYVGASPDALRDGMTVQAKCPGYSAWIDTAIARDIPSQYRWQCRWEAWVAGMQKFSFFVWHPAAGGVIVDGEVTQSECDQMADRAAVVNHMVTELVGKLEGI